MTGLGARSIFGLTGFVVLMSAGQVLFKLAADSLPPLTRLASVPALLHNWWLWMAFALYGGATLLWVALLQRLPLSVAYPFVAVSFVTVPLVAAVLFHEPLTLRYAAGVALILAGIYLVQVG